MSFEMLLRTKRSVGPGRNEARIFPTLGVGDFLFQGVSKVLFSHPERTIAFTAPILFPTTAGTGDRQPTVSKLDFGFFRRPKDRHSRRLRPFFIISTSRFIPDIDKNTVTAYLSPSSGNGDQSRAKGQS